MRIAGLRKTSLIDFPERISTVIFTAGCNFFCSYCHNSQLISLEKEEEIDYLAEKSFYNFLESRKSLIDGVTITGGEPTLQPDLKKFIRNIKDYFDLEIKLDTNGSRPFLIEELLEDKLVDYFALDLKLSWSRYPLLAPENKTEKIKKSLKIIMNSAVEYELRTTVVPGLHDISEIEKIAAAAEGAQKYFIQNFRPLNTLDPDLEKMHPFTSSELKAFKNTAEKFIDDVHIRD